MRGIWHGIWILASGAVLGFFFLVLLEVVAIIHKEV
jgi:hypothetical protein